MLTQDRLSDRCTEVATSASAALAWVTDEENADIVGLARKSLVATLRRGRRRAEKLGRSAKTKMSVSVFGPSQAGKSFLVSVLARPADGRLVADFNGPGGRLDYISQINPAGDGESTGLVTRFTMTKAPTPDGFPIQLNLLSEADIARTIINSFFEDGDQSEPEPDPETLKTHFQAHASKVQAGEVQGLGFEEMYEIAEYVQNSFGKVAYAAGLRGFWEEAAQMAPRMAIADRAAFLSILWGGYQELTDLYIKLATALAQIDHAEVAYAPLAALHPRETSIIDVNTLQGLFRADKDDLLPLRTPSGKETKLNRAIVCALAAELVFPMETQPSEFFSQTDLLDFPGARNRFELPLAKTLERPEEAVTNMFLRGKVAYLFDRYVANQEITSMLLCVPDSNMETLSLPGLVENWIATTHGPTPEDRRNSDCILFFVMTKFDKHLGESASGGSASERFERRMDASLLKGFGKVSDSWVHKWTPDQPFNNCYWLRNPNYFVEGLLEYDDNQRELAIRKEKLERVAELREGCLATPSVRAHFADPEVAWDAALKLNDGGVGYLIDQLTKVCKPDSKVRQIGAQVEKLAADLARDLQQYHVSDDIEKRIEEKQQAAADVIEEFEIALRRHRFGAVLSSFMVDQDFIRDRISRIPSSIRISSAVSSAAATNRATPQSSGGFADLVKPGARSPSSGASATAPQKAGAPAPAGEDVRTMTPETFQAETAIEVWIEGLKRFREDVDMVRRFGLTETGVANVNAELSHALRRVGVVEQIEAQLRDMSFGLTVDKQAEPAAIVCAERINKFVTTLGTETMQDSEKPIVSFGNGQSRQVFSPRKYADSADTLPANARAVAVELWTDWVFALDAMFVANAKDTDAGAINIEQNLRLGKILGGLNGGARVA